MRPPLRIVAPLYNRSGFAAAGRALVRTALVAGFDVQAVEAEIIRETDVIVDGGTLRTEKTERPMHVDKGLPEHCGAEILEAIANVLPDAAPTLFLMNPSGQAAWPIYSSGPRIGFTMLESDTLHPLWASAARNVDVLVVPSEFNRRAFETAHRGLKSPPLHVMPLPIDDRVFTPEGEVAEVLYRPRFLFLSVFSTCERKNWRVMMQAFAEEFRGEDVGLLCHCNHRREVEEMAQWCREMGAWISVHDEPLSEPDMAALYRACDCLIGVGCEGFGLPVAEAALCGKPSVVQCGGGVSDVSVAAYRVSAESSPSIGHLPQIYGSDHHMFAPMLDRLREVMRRAYESDSQPDALGDAIARLTPAALGGQLRKIVDEACTAHARRIIEIERLPAPTGPELAVVITTHNNLLMTKRCVAEVRRHTPCVRIVLADDGSTDDTYQWAEDPRNDVEIVPTPVAGHVSLARHWATKHLQSGGWTGEICYMDNDVEVGLGWWWKLHALLNANPHVGIIAPLKVYGADGIYGHGGASRHYLAGEVQNVGNRLQFNGKTLPMRLERPEVWPDYVESACMVVRPEVWQACEWPKEFPIWYEDADYCLQARKRGWDIMATNLVRVVHHAHSTGRGRFAEAEERRKTFISKWKGCI